MVFIKKYFLLFAASFIAFEACLIAGSSSSYGMEPEFDEANQSIVLYNSQGQKTQKLPLYAEDLAADLRLNPTKGETLWFEKSKLITIPGYQEPFDVEGDIEITLSPIARLEDCFVVQLGLHAYNLSKIEDFPEWLLKTPANQDIAEHFQESLVLEFDHLLPVIGLDKTTKLLVDVETDAYGRGARRAYAIVSNEDDNLRPLSPAYFDRLQWINILKENHYQQSGAAYDLHNNLYIQHFFKELTPVLPDPQEDLFTKWECQWILEENEPRDFSGFFGLFVRKKGYIKGGILGKIHENAFIPHSSLGVLWVDEKFRGMSLGTKLMNFALKHSKERGAHVAELRTADWQAPGFYGKIGFEKIITNPNILKTLDVRENHLYIYRKEL